jgi:hypothetical protein
MKKYLNDLVFVFLATSILVGLAIWRDIERDKPNKRWLAAAKHMVTVTGDNLPSTPDPERVKILLEWAIQSGYKATVFWHDPNMPDRRGMYFILLEKDPQ